MNLLFRIVYAAHATGTHHKLALDALRHLQCMDADLWQRLFLAHAKVYLEGSKAPDTQFKDFKNHVLHTRDGYWGGAPEKVRSWYQHLVEALAQQDWQTAVHSAGVLSHYYTDPLQPLHTAQSEAENNIHRAVEWSISKAYDELARQGETEFGGMSVDLPSGPNWLAQLVCQGAERANRDYEKLIAHYDIQRGVVDPPAGLDRVARRLIAELIRYAAISYAAVLDRAIEESNVHPPSVPLAGATLAAVGQVPFKLIARRIADADERRQVERMYDELLATGTVETHLAEDDRAVRDLHAVEVLANRPPQPAVSKVFPFKVPEPAVTRRRAGASGARRREASAGANVVPLRPAPPAGLGRRPRWPTSRSATKACGPAGRGRRRTYAHGRRAVGAAGAHDGRSRCLADAQPAPEHRAALPSDARSRRRRRSHDRPEDGRAPLPARHQDGRRSPQGGACGPRRAGQQPSHHARDHRRLAGPGAARLHGAGAPGHARAAAGRRRLSLGARRSPRPMPTSCAPMSSPSPRPRTDSACCATAIRPTSRRSRAGSRPP